MTKCAQAGKAFHFHDPTEKDRLLIILKRLRIQSIKNYQIGSKMATDIE